jgi:hypothetical protein
VVAPVRETCAQALGAVLKYMHPSLVCHTLNILLQMQVCCSSHLSHPVKFQNNAFYSSLPSLSVSVLCSFSADKSGKFVMGASLALNTWSLFGR